MAFIARTTIKRSLEDISKMNIYCRMWVRLVGFYRMRVRAYVASNKNHFQSQCLFNSKAHIYNDIHPPHGKQNPKPSQIKRVYAIRRCLSKYVLFLSLGWFFSLLRFVFFFILVLNTFSITFLLFFFYFVLHWNCYQCCRIAKVCGVRSHNQVSCLVLFIIQVNMILVLYIKCKYWFGISTEYGKTD